MRRIKFIANRDFALTLNRIYEIQNEQADRYYVINDRNNVQAYAKNLFEVIEDDQPVQNEPDNAPAPRRRGRPTNAELEARRNAANNVQQAPPAPVENAAARRAREAREALERRGRLWTEQDVADSVTAELHPFNGSSTRFKMIIKYNNKERINDAPVIVERNTQGVYIVSDNAFSCGVNRLTDIESFLSSIHSILNYQDEDYEILREALFAKAGEAFMREFVVGGLRVRNAAIELVSVTVNDDNEIDYRDILTRHFGFTQAGEARVNPNSGNPICVLSRTRA